MYDYKVIIDPKWPTLASSVSWHCHQYRCKLIAYNPIESFKFVLTSDFANKKSAGIEYTTTCLIFRSDLELRQQFLKQSIIQAGSTGDFSPPPEVYPWNISFSLIRHNQIAITAFKPHYKWEARERKWSMSLKTYFLSCK